MVDRPPLAISEASERSTGAFAYKDTGSVVAIGDLVGTSGKLPSKY